MDPKFLLVTLITQNTLHDCNNEDAGILYGTHVYQKSILCFILRLFWFFSCVIKMIKKRRHNTIRVELIDYCLKRKWTLAPADRSTLNPYYVAENILFNRLCGDLSIAALYCCINAICNCSIYVWWGLDCVDNHLFSLITGFFYFYFFTIINIDSTSIRLFLCIWTVWVQQSKISIHILLTSSSVFEPVCP